MGLAAWPWFRRHLQAKGGGDSFLPRLGLQLPPPPPPGSPRLWIHGVSVGEILSATALVRALETQLPGASLTLSTGTETGQAVARRHFSAKARVCYFPLDLPWAVQGYLSRMRPDAFIALESEIWPGFLTAAHRRGVRLALLNARMSEDSFRKYLKYGRLLIDIINYFDTISVGSNQDYERLLALGVSRGKLHFTGNLKVDGLLARQEETLPEIPKIREKLALDREPVFLAASTHAGEEELVLESYSRLLIPYPALLLILAPRHPERAAAVGRLIESRGLAWQSWQRLKAGAEARSAPVVLVDTIGDLFSLYGLASAAFVGGSLVPHGGQNILEAAAWGLAPLHGPYLQNFRWAETLLAEAGAHLQVQDSATLTAATHDCLAHPDEARARGQRARDSLTPHQGAARRQTRLIAAMFNK
jgi:3-deoxy-D-manno-octulosonic-acid transferase